MEYFEKYRLKASVLAFIFSGFSCFVFSSCTPGTPNTFYVLGGGQNTTLSPILFALSYAGVSGTVGSPNYSMMITPGYLVTGGTPLRSCQIKPNSSNAAQFPMTLSVDPSTCTISGTPSALLAPTQFTILATNLIGYQTEAQVTLSVVNCSSELTPYGGGDGSSSNPYKLCSPLHVDNMRNNLGSVFQLSTDIDLLNYTLSPIGTYGSPFIGSFDGNNHKLSNLTIISPGNDRVGLFGVIDSPRASVQNIQNLTLNSVQIIGQNEVGALAGELRNAGSISNVSTSGTVTSLGSGASAAGGLLGQAVGSRGSLTPIISYCASSATVSGVNKVGGLVGYLSAANLIHSNASGQVIASAQSNTGGLVGEANSSAQISTSYATGNVTNSAGGNSGGLVGYIQSSSAITNSYATGSVDGGSSGYAGGIFGQSYSSSTLTNSYAVNKVTASGASVGGLTGNDPGGPAPASHWNTDAGPSVSSSGTALTTARMQNASQYVINYGNWDFTTVWNLPSPGNYPSLK